MTNEETKRAKRILGEIQRHWKRDEGFLLESDEPELVCKYIKKTLRLEDSGLVEAITIIRTFLEGSPIDILGNVDETHDSPSYWIRDAMIDRITKALKKFQGDGE